VKNTHALLLKQLARNVREYRKAAGFSQGGVSL
jgi:hypothetical protein